MRLNQEETRIVEGVKKHLDKIAPMGISCSVCKHRNWKIFTKIFEVREFYPDSAMGGPSRLPVISVMCTNCSNTLFFNAIELEIVPADTKEGDLK